MQYSIKVFKTIAKAILPQFLIDQYRKISAQHQPQYAPYSSVTLTEEDIERGAYKQCLGGGSENWESRGYFQLLLLQKMGLTKKSKVLDVGCGPGRASKYLIDFLDESHYFGVDYNADFIEAARVMSEKNRLVEKNPFFEVVHDFDFSQIPAIIDYAMVFSVLNHCNIEQKKAFFNMMPMPLKEGGKVYISHAHWFGKSYIRKTRLEHTNSYGVKDFDTSKFAWKEDERLFPIIELTRY